MTDNRRYSVDEIDDMRRSIRWRELRRPGAGYLEAEMSARVEDMLRTYMLNGTDPEELK